MGVKEVEGLPWGSCAEINGDDVGVGGLVELLH